MNLNQSPVIPYNYANAHLKSKLHANDLAEMLWENERFVCVHMDAGMQKQMLWTLFCGCTHTHIHTHPHTYKYTHSRDDVWLGG